MVLNIQKLQVHRTRSLLFCQPGTHPNKKKIPKLLNPKLSNTAKLQEVNAANLNASQHVQIRSGYIFGKRKIDRLVQRLECAQPDFAPGSSSLSSFHQKTGIFMTWNHWLEAADIL